MSRFCLLTVLFLLSVSVSIAADKDLEIFWESFRTALSEGNENKIIEMTYFASEDERTYFSFNLIFDNDAIIAITQATADSLKMFSDKNAEYDDNPFEILVLPEEVKEVYLIKIEYEDNTVAETSTYQRVYAFGKLKGKYLFLGFYSVG